MQGACAVLYCHLCLVRLYSIFPHYLINDTIKKKTLLNIKMCVSLFHATFVRTISHFKHNSAGYHKCTCFHVKYPLIVSYFKRNLNFLDRSSRNTISNLMKNPFIGSRVIPCGLTDRHDEANSRFSPF